MSMEDEWRRLQQLYAVMSDEELLELARGKAGLTEVAQQAVEAEMGSRGLELQTKEKETRVEWAPELSASEDDPSVMELMTFPIATDAETAFRELDDRGIPVRMEPAMRRLTDDGPKIKTNWLTIFVERTRQEEAVNVLRERMGLFPVLAADEVDDSDDAGDGEDDKALFTVGEFEVDADAETARKALAEAGVWFNAERETQEAHDGQPAFDGTVIEVRLKDLEKALAVVEAAFREEGQN